MSAARPGSARAWLLATRPATLTAAAAPVLLGTAVAHASGGVHVPAAAAALLGALLIQVLTNFANDVFDHEKGADTEARLGPTRAVQAGLLTARQVRAGMIACALLAFPVGTYLAARGGAPIVAIGVLSILSGIAYTGGPYPLGYHGLGDVFVFVFFGLVAVGGTTYVQTLSVPTLALLAGAGSGAIATAVLVVNNVRDRGTDVGAGKRTLAVRFGKGAAVAEYAGLFALAYGVVVAARLGPLRHDAVLLPLLTAPFAVWLTRRLAREEGRPLNAVLGQTALLLLGYGVLFSAGLVLAAG